MFATSFTTQEHGRRSFADVWSNCRRDRKHQRSVCSGSISLFCGLANSLHIVGSSDNNLNLFRSLIMFKREFLTIKKRNAEVDFNFLKDFKSFNGIPKFIFFHYLTSKILTSTLFPEDNYVPQYQRAPENEYLSNKTQSNIMHWFYLKGNY